MGMAVVGFDPVMDTAVLNEVGIQKVSLDEIWAKCDFITVHTPLTEDTKNIVNDETISKCKRGVGIVNCARGGIIDEEALLRGLESGDNRH
jgi:D-3-phosphoglycerate dehydrogenase / 2-oxoglutarate reductase